MLILELNVNPLFGVNFAGVIFLTLIDAQGKLATAVSCANRSRLIELSIDSWDRMFLFLDSLVESRILLRVFHRMVAQLVKLASLSSPSVHRCQWSSTARCHSSSFRKKHAIAAAVGCSLETSAQMLSVSCASVTIVYGSSWNFSIAKTMSGSEKMPLLLWGGGGEQKLSFQG